MKKKLDIETLKIFFKGILMGLFDLVPGVSGGTMALITGIYESLIQEINHAFKFIKSLLQINKEKIKKTWRKLNKEFLAALIIGIITGIYISVMLMQYFLENHFAQTMGTITGLILIASIKLIKKHLIKKTILIGLIGLTLGYILSITTPTIGYDFNYAQIFLLGAITITAMILPGISGALILLLLGGYEFMISALRGIKENYIVVGTFIAGAIMGLGAFSQSISYMLKKHHDETMTFLSTLMLGAITKPILEIINTTNPNAAIPFVIASMILGYFVIQK